MDRMLWARFGEATLKAPPAIQWLSDNGPKLVHERKNVPLVVWRDGKSTVVSAAELKRALRAKTK
jgi:hypothetical protein